METKNRLLEEAIRKKYEGHNIISIKITNCTSNVSIARIVYAVPNADPVLEKEQWMFNMILRKWSEIIDGKNTMIL